MILRSPIRCSINRTSHSGLIESKKDRISASRIQLILHALIPYASASSASCWRRPGRNPVAKPQELRLVDRREDRHHRRLDYLILDGCDAERPLLAIGLRYVLPARRQRSIRPCVDPRVEIDEVGLEVLRVLVTCHLIDARCGAPLQIEEGPPQAVDADMMQERREAFLLAPGNGLAYAALRL